MARTLLRRASLACTLGVCVLAGPLQAAPVTATFEDLATLPALDGATGFEFANGGNLNYAGAHWDGGFTVVGDAYRVSPTDGPLFGLPHDGHYFITNGSSGADGLLIMTTQVLTGAWFGGNEYYGFGGGADQVTIFALAGSTALGAVTAELPDLAPGLPEVLAHVDTSIFRDYTGITGYRIDRHPSHESASNWVADDFTFEDATPVPLPGTLGLLGGGLALFGRRRRRAH